VRAIFKHIVRSTYGQKIVAKSLQIMEIEDIQSSYELLFPIYHMSHVPVTICMVKSVAKSLLE
jgi:hypothetical protein